MTMANVSDRAIAHTAPRTPRSLAAGIPIAIEMELETKVATKTEEGYSMANKALPMPKNPHQETDARATMGNREATSVYLPE
jgi:hypothetical protein